MAVVLAFFVLVVSGNGIDLRAAFRDSSIRYPPLKSSYPKYFAFLNPKNVFLKINLILCLYHRARTADTLSLSEVLSPPVRMLSKYRLMYF